LLFASLALCAIAAPAGNAEPSKPFKIGVTIDKKTVYLTKTATASENIADGVTCTIADKGDVKGVITCNDNLGYYYSERHPFEGALVPLTTAQAEALENSNRLFYGGYSKSNKNWSIDANNNISWKTEKTGPAPTKYNVVHFSKSVAGAANQIYAEICSTYGHPDGKAFKWDEVKAYFV